MFLERNFYKRDGFFEYLKKLGYNLDVLKATAKNDLKLREKVSKIYKNDYLFRVLGVSPDNENYTKRWLFLWIVKNIRDDQVKKEAKKVVGKLFTLDPKKARYLLSEKYKKIFEETISSQKLKAFKNLLEIFKNQLEDHNLKMMKSYERISEERELPFKSKEHYFKIVNELLESKEARERLQGLILATGLRPSDIKEGDFAIADGKLFISEIKKTGLTDKCIYTMISPYKLLINIKFIQNLSKKENDKLIKLSRKKENGFKIMKDLGISRDYDFRSLFGNTLYYYFRNEIKKEFGLAEFEMTKPAFLNLVLHHIDGSSSFMNYSNYVF